MAALRTDAYDRSMVKVVFVIVVIGVVIFALIDLIQVGSDQVRGGSKFLWAVVILLLPLIGAVAWLWLGRAPSAPSGPGIVPPDDDPDFLRGIDSP